MARDEALLQAVGDGAQPPTLRLYAWSPPTISLGYFQPYAEYDALPPPAGTLAVVRRATGGGAILHDAELTYSLALPIDHPWAGRSPNDLYERVHRAIIAAVGGQARLFRDAAGANVKQQCCDAARRGPFFCFARRHGMDVVVPDSTQPSGWSKLAGSAQRRTARGVLQHGSLILERRFAQQPCAAWSALGGPADFSAAACAIFRAITGSQPATDGRTGWPERLIPSVAIHAEKYAANEWTLHR